MPSPSKAQRRLMAIAEHHPEEVQAKNRGVLKMTRRQLHEFASTPEKGLPEHKRSARKKVPKAGRKPYKNYEPHNAIGEH